MGFPSFIWMVGALLVVGAVLAAALMQGQEGDAEGGRHGALRRRRYLVGDGSAFHFFRDLEELMGHRFYVFPQVQVSQLIDARAATWRERLLMRCRIERRSVDFVLCDKDTVAPRVAIELDVPDRRPESRKGDAVVDQALKTAGIPFVRIDPADLRDKLHVADKIFDAIDRHETEPVA